MRTQLLLSCLAFIISAAATGPAGAQTNTDTAATPADAATKAAIPPGPLNEALNRFAERTGLQVVYVSAVADHVQTSGAAADLAPEATLDALLVGTGLSYRFLNDKTITVDTPEALARAAAAAAAAEESADPNVAAAPADSSAVADIADASAPSAVTSTRSNGIEEIIVTAQKKEERIQDIPIAISAFSPEDLNAQKLEGGFDLLKAIPNVTFSKSNFSGYNFSIRGVGTKAISATTDPGVSVSFNSTGLIQNRLFEQEYFDVERIEVLRGPQGTLYGRNATGGVINVISAKPKFNVFEGSVKSEVGNYGSRRGVGMLNVPILDDILALRVAGSFTQRDGYGYNDVTGNNIDGRDLWSSRVTLSYKPLDAVRADLIWEHFDEDDNRARTSKQLCHKDPGLAEVGGAEAHGELQRALFSTGCKAGSLYDKAAFDTPNGLALPSVFAIPALADRGYAAGSVDGNQVSLIGAIDPYAGVTQNHDLRTISSLRDPKYTASADVLELNLNAQITDNLTFVSQTAYNDDSTYSTQDFNRFNTQPIFNDSSKWLDVNGFGPSEYQNLSPGGVFCDPQLGCSNTMVFQDIASGDSTQFSQELRLQSSFDGPLNFSAGANYTHFDFEANYYIMSNILTALSVLRPLGEQPDYTKCGYNGDMLDVDDPSIPNLQRCIYVDPNPLGQINGDGHNYYRSRNPYTLDSYAAFGELYWQIQPALKLTVGLRYTDDHKDFTPVPTQLLLSPRALVGGGDVYRGYPEQPTLKQRWQEPTGRIVLDWKPKLSFTDETLVYGSYSRGYKAGGANPPSIGLSMQTIAEQLGVPTDSPHPPLFDVPMLRLTAVNYPETFKPEYVNAFEVGTKNTLLHGAMMLNATAFYYDYKDYQVSKIVDRTAVNENFDAQVWGAEFETLFAPTADWVVNANLGLLDTRIGGGSRSIDITNRTQGDPNYVVVKPWFQLPSNCVVPVDVAAYYLDAQNAGTPGAVGLYGGLCGGSVLGNGLEATPVKMVPPGYDPTQNPNGGAGIAQNLKGNELPNSPHWTANIGTQYTFHFKGDWDLTLRGDYYRQGNSYARVYNAVNDRLKGWGNANASIAVARPNDDLVIELYVKNIFDDDPITDAFINSDDAGLTTNVFVLDPRIIGLSIKKGF